MIVNNVLAQRVIFAVISTCVTQGGLDDTQKDNFQGSLINVVRKLREKKIVLSGDFYGLIGGFLGDYEDQHGG